MDDPAPTSHEDPRASRFELAPPRGFVLPAVLLLLSERPGYGYSLDKELQELSFGRIDRPTVYRALAQLEADELVQSWAEATPGHERRVYSITPLGERVLRVWMHVIKEERDLLGRVLRRYQATGTVDSVLAEVEGGWAAALGFGWSPVSPTSGARRHVGGPAVTEPHAGPTGGSPAAPARAAAPTQRFTLDADRSVVLIDVRSSVGPISFGAAGLTGALEAAIDGGALSIATPPRAHLEIAVDGLRSGNSLYDAELLRRIDARRFPVATIDLTECLASVGEGRFRLDGELTFHGVTRGVEGTVHVAVDGDDRVVVTGEQVFDIRDFDLPSPTVLMLRIYPDIRVHLHVEARLERA